MNTNADALSHMPLRYEHQGPREGGESGTKSPGPGVIRGPAPIAKRRRFRINCVEAWEYAA